MRIKSPLGVVANASFQGQFGTVLHLESARASGGSVRSLATLLRYGRETRRFRHIVCLYSPLPEIEEVEALADGCHFVPSDPDTNSQGSGRLSRTISNARWFCRLIERERVEIVRFNNFPSEHKSALIATRLKGLPCIASLRSFPWTDAVSRLRTRLFTRMCDHLVANSNSVRDAFLALGVSSSRISTIYNGTEVASKIRPPNLSEGIRRVGMIGRLVRWKGLHAFVRAAQLVVSTASNVQFEIFGSEDPSEPQFKEELSQEIDRLGLGERVFLRGYTPNPERVYRSLYCLVNASYPAEPFGNSIIEAMANGCPVIATDGGGPCEIIEHGRSGVLVQPNSPEDLAGAILTLLKNPQERARFALNAHCRVSDQFEVRQQTDKQEMLLARFLRLAEAPFQGNAAAQAFRGRHVG